MVEYLQMLIQQIWKEEKLLICGNYRGITHTIYILQNIHQNVEEGLRPDAENLARKFQGDFRVETRFSRNSGSILLTYIKQL